ncbi:PAS domain-containing protein [Sphingomicrobium flavum]|uniref:PAS domain-containing protein n=1 Tax=Sphingomicrobium flavum TaxID=1229164 RepID=UPI0021ADEA4C|nr:PAS domain-containing protein [Sphingomicrobium flavum]
MLNSVADPHFCEPANDAARVAVLQRYDLESLEDDPDLNGIRSFAAKLFDAPIALVSLVGADHQRFLSRQGIGQSSTPRSISFCQHAMLREDVMVVADASNDPLFKDNPLVTGEPGIRFYAGAPLISEEGAPMGTLCVIDRVPRDGISDLQREGLKVLAAAVLRRLTTRRREVEMTAGREEADRLLQASQRQFDNLADALPQMAWSTDAEGIPDYFNQRWYDFTGTKPGEHFSEKWVELLHPDDRERAAAVWGKAVASGEPYEVEYRMRGADGDYRWTLARGLPVMDDGGQIIRWFGSNTDIHQTRLLIEGQELLSRELSHRIKNIFSVVAGLVSFASRAHPQMKDLATTLSDRIAALGRAHNYVRPIADQPAQRTSLQALLGDLFAPYEADGQARVHIRGDDRDVGEGAVTPLALAFHELATNAVKYGGLSTNAGRVDIAIDQQGDELVVTWRENGGPSVAGEPERRGFGSDLIQTSIVRQLKGSVERDWGESGLVATIRLPVDRIA